MSWLAKLYETYEAGARLDLPEDEKMMPVSHTLQNAHIKIVIDGGGSFRSANVLEKTQLILPATEGSAGRSGKCPPPHPLSDKLQYVAKDYPDFGGAKPSFYAEYHSLITLWNESDFSHPKVDAVCRYISNGSVISDLVREGILHVDGDHMLLTKWPFEDDDEHPVPPIFKVLPKQKDKQTGESLTEQGSALVCWSVESEDDPDTDTWSDVSLHESWIKFDALEGGLEGLCYVSGEQKPIAVNHPAKLRHTGDKAKLVSSNDSSGFTFRGRFTDKNGAQAAGVSFEVTQKAHNALRWLITRQGYRNGEQVYVAWAASCKDIPDPLAGSWDMLGKPAELQTEATFCEEIGVDHGVDLGASFARQFNNYLAGYRARLEPNEQIVVMGLDSATPGRMGIIYYRELLASEFLQRMESWHNQFAWPQRHTIELENKKKGKTPISKTIWPVSSPVPRIIAEAAYGDVLKSNETLKKSLLERILPCIVDGRPFPQDIMFSAIRRACNRNVKRLPDKFSNIKSELAEWEKHLGVACALYKGFFQRHPDIKQRRTYAMTLEENNSSRDYLYGRLLAIAERIEEIALSVGGENRPTTAARLMQRFADRPFSTWRNIELGLQPYMQRLQNSRAGFLTNRKKELDAVSCAFLPGEFTSEKALSGEFLLGFHCQRQSYRNNQSETTQED